jgi:hypothetical protein
MSIVEDLKSLLIELKRLKNEIKKEKSDRIHKESLRVRSEGLSNIWFSEIQNIITDYDFISNDVIKKYRDYFTRLIKISAPSNRKTSYLETLDNIVRGFNDDLIMPIITNRSNIQQKNSFSNFFLEFNKIPEKNYLDEAIGCAENGFFRAATVLAWNAVVYRFHTIIERNGFHKFNSTSKIISSKNTGRFKRYNKTFNISDRNELGEVFDTDILWILEGMMLIDSNEHTRIKSCYDMRCQAAHPGNAPILEYNLLSFFSDIKEIIFKNKNFNYTGQG